MKTMRIGFVARLVMLALGLGMCASAAQAGPCPPGLPPGTDCLDGVDIHGAFYLIAVPANYNGNLVLWNHGYTLSPPKPLTATDLGVAGGLLPFGFAAAASSYRADAIGLQGWAVADGAQDTELLRQRFVDMWGKPNMTFVVGASEGGIITAEMAELFGQAEDGSLNYDGAMPMCGPLAGGQRNWFGGFDLRVVYQYYCQNLPQPSDAIQYPLYLGIVPLTFPPPEVVNRVNQCTGVLLPPQSRTPQQQSNLDNILNVTRIPESFLITDMNFATFGLGELAQVRTGGLSPVTNLGVWYSGSTDDEALNAGVFRAGENPQAAEFLRNAYDPTGEIPMPVLTIHTIGDGLVVVENEHEYKETVRSAHHRQRLQQNYVNAGGHCQFTNSEVLAAFQSLVAWVSSGERPGRSDVADLCETLRPIFGDTCNFNLDFKPDDIATRIPDRDPGM